MFKRFNIYELDYKLIHSIGSAVPAHTRFWLAVKFDFVV